MRRLAVLAVVGAGVSFVLYQAGRWLMDEVTRGTEAYLRDMDQAGRWV